MDFPERRPSLNLNNKGIPNIAPPFAVSNPVQGRSYPRAIAPPFSEHRPPFFPNIAPL